MRLFFTYEEWHVAFIQTPCFLDSVVRSGSHATVQHRESPGFKLHAEVCVSQTHMCHVNWFQESFEPQRNLCGAY